MASEETSIRTIALSSSAEARLTRAAAWLAERKDELVTIVAPSIDAAGEIARRGLLVTPPASSGTPRAAFGWQRATLGVLAASIARPELVRRGLVPATPLALEAISARVVHQERGRLGRFEPVAERPGLPRALARTLGELRLADAGAIAVSGTTARKSKKAAKDDDLARLAEAFEAELEQAGLADRAMTFELATEAVRGGAFAPSSLLLIDVPIRSRKERDLVAAISERSPHVLALVPAGDPRSSAYLGQALGVDEANVVHLHGEGPLASLQDGLFGGATDVAAKTSGDAIAVLSAPGESRECVEIARLVLREAARGTPLDRIAVLLRAPQYGAHVLEAFRRARIPVFFARGAKRPDPAGRALLSLLACAGEGLSARRFAEYLSLGEVPDDVGGEPPSPTPRPDRVAPPDEETLLALLGNAANEANTSANAEDEDADAVRSTREDEADRAAAFGSLRTPRHWERLLVDAAVIGGRDRWERRLSGLAHKLATDLEAYEKKDEEALADAVRRDVRGLDALTRFALPLVDALATLPARAPWSEWVDVLSSLATRAIRRPERVLGVLAELEPVGRAWEASLADVRMVLEPRLSQLQLPATGRRYGKVFVATIDEARATSFDVVFVPGLAEKLFPQKVVEDPLLLDDARRAQDPALATNDERTADERLALRIAIGAATRRVVLSYPRLDVEQARPRTPSFYGLEVLRVADGELRGFEHLATRAAEAADARIGWPAPRKREDAIDEAEYDLAVLDEILKRPEDTAIGQAHYLLHTNEHLSRALRFRGRRWLTSWKATDGLVDPPEEALLAIREHATTKRSFSPTALQNFAACPYRFLLSAVHKLAPRQEPAPIEDLDPLTRGSLVHEVQYELLTKLREEKLLPVTEATLETARQRLEEVLGEVSAKFHDQHHPAIERVWDDAMTSIAADLREWLRLMSLDRTWVPAHFELSFGLKDPRAQDAKSSYEPVTLDIGLKLRGSIDLVEKNLEGELRATDHKTGKVKAKDDGTIVGGGEILQPVLYALTLEKLFPGVHVEEGRLYYCTAAGEFKAVPIPLTPPARESAKVVAQTIGEAIDKGFLPTAPLKDKRGYSACTYCDFRTVCGPYEDVRTRRKTRAPLKALVELRRLK